MRCPLAVFKIGLIKLRNWKPFGNPFCNSRRPFQYQWRNHKVFVRSSERMRFEELLWCQFASIHPSAKTYFVRVILSWCKMATLTTSVDWQGFPSKDYETRHLTEFSEMPQNDKETAWHPIDLTYISAIMFPQNLVTGLFECWKQNWTVNHLTLLSSQ